ncbi:MAG: rhomboid family intramembrane serine protease [bacterium]|nr:rhomboid family intramembrane serine protease [bacterium]
MHCPTCQIRLVRGASKDGYLWACRSCGGSLASMPVLRRGLQPALANELWANKETTWPHPGRPCSICRQDMDETAVRRIVLDVCRRCQFVWFDRLEFESLTTADTVRPFVYFENEFEANKIETLEERIDYYKDHVEELNQELSEVRNESQLSIPDNWRKFPFLLGIPIQMSGGPRGVPLLTYLMAAGALLLSLINFIDLDAARELYAFDPSAALRFGGVTLFSYVSVHPGLISLAVNIYMLVLFGDDLEDLIGRKKSSLLVLLSILAGALGHAAFYQWDGPLLTGIEPLVCALIVAYTLRFPYARMGAILPLPLISPYINTPAWGFAGIWFLLYLPGYFIFGEASASVPALVGGGLAGALSYLTLVRVR